MEADGEKIIELAFRGNAADEVSQAPGAHNVSRQKKGRTRRHERLVDYYSELTKEEVTALFDVYRPDFELFGYSVGEYWNAAAEIDSMRALPDVPS